VVGQLDREQSELFADLLTDPVAPRVGAALAVMQEEHADIARRLDELRDLSDGYIAPGWASPAYRVLLDGLARFEADTRRLLRTEDGTLLFRIIGRRSPP
jgi:iron-sulfur cluster repair protein YtfE (RIC family)